MEGKMAVTGCRYPCDVGECGACASLYIEPCRVLFLAGGPLEQIALVRGPAGEGCEGEASKSFCVK